MSLSETLQKTMRKLGFSEFTPIQMACIPLILEGHDLIGQSQTGSGKTAAFVLPILNNINLGILRPQALILCPTRELCDQVLRECRKFSQGLTGFRSVALVGGQDHKAQVQELKKGAHLLVGTPGRTLEHIKSDTVDLGHLSVLVLDEADRLLEEGFTEEMTSILELLPDARQTLMFSATFPEGIESLSKKYQKNPRRIHIDQAVQALPQIEQFLYSAENPEKENALIQILKTHPSNCTLIFCRTKQSVNGIGERLKKAKVSAEVLHGDLEQTERDKVTSLFRNGSLRVLVATDIAARGLDIENLEMVVNVDLPSSPEIYIHRIGRTGRAGKKGVAVSIATDYEITKVAEIEAMTGVKMIRKRVSKNQGENFAPVMLESATKTIQIFGGRDHKLRPGDILGALTGLPNPLLGSDIGKIEIRDKFTFVAVSSSVADMVLEKLKTVKIKGSRYKAYLA